MKQKKSKAGEMNGSESGRQTFGKWSKGLPCELPETDRQNEEQNLQFRKFLKVTKNFKVFRKRNADVTGTLFAQMGNFKIFLKKKTNSGAENKLWAQKNKMGNF